MAAALQSGNKVHANNLEKNSLKRTLLAGRKAMFKSKKKGSSGFADNGFSTLMTQMKKKMMTMTWVTAVTMNKILPLQEQRGNVSVDQ